MGGVEEEGRGEETVGFGEGEGKGGRGFGCRHVSFLK